MKERVFAIVSKVLKMPLEEVHEELSPGNVKSWDSFNHVQLILSLEHEFGISLGGDEIIEMRSVGKIIEIIGKKV